ncbi:hypothetical protein D3C85_1591510 [compost metagenome]
MADSSSLNLKLCGFLAMSFGVARAFFGSFSSIRPAFCSRINARPLLLPSFGIAMVAPSGSSARVLYLLE